MKKVSITFMEVFARGVEARSIRGDTSLELLAVSSVALIGGLGWLHAPASANPKQIADAMNLVRQAFEVLLRGARPDAHQLPATPNGEGSGY